MILTQRGAGGQRAAPRRCYESGNAGFIEFSPDLRTRRGFAAAQFLHYTLEPNPELTLGDSPAPRERLVFTFFTADVVVFGARLSFLVALLRDQRLTPSGRSPSVKATGAVAAIRIEHHNTGAQQAGRARLRGKK